jgi:zinc transporter ZupT
VVGGVVLGVGWVLGAVVGACPVFVFPLNLNLGSRVPFTAGYFLLSNKILQEIFPRIFLI